MINANSWAEKLAAIADNSAILDELTMVKPDIVQSRFKVQNLAEKKLSVSQIISDSDELEAHALDIAPCDIDNFSLTVGE